MAARKGVLADMRLVWKLFQLNVQGAMEYRVSFLMNVTFMALNNLCWLGFWWLFFRQFDEVGGWQLGDVILLFTVSATGFGIAHILFGNLNRLSILVSEGRLDVALSQPRDPLLKLLASRTSVPAVGDLIFGIGVFLLVGELHLLPLFLVLTCMSAAVFTAFAVCAHSLAFWTGQSEGVSRTLVESALMFSMYPDGLFSGGVRFLLYTLIPSGLISYLPVRLMRSLDPRLGLLYLAATLGLVIFSRWVFARGLRRYESGNQLVVNI